MMTKAEFNYRRLKATTQGMNILSYMCFVISAAFTIMLMFDSAAVPLKQVLSVIMAICLEIAKVYFFRYLGDKVADAENGGNLPGKYALYALTVALFVASTFGSIHYYMKTEAEKSSVDKQHDSSYSSMNKDVESIDTQIAQLLALAKSQQEKRYITASQQTMAKVNELRKQKADALKNVSGYKAQDTSDSFYGLLGKFFGCEPEAAKGALYLFLSILLEFCGIASAFYGSYNKSKLFEMELAMMPDGDIRQVVNREPDRREAGFRMSPPPMSASAMARYREADEAEYDDAPPVPPKKKNIGFVVEKPEPVRSQSQSEFPSKDDVLDQMQRQLAELMARDKARSEAARPTIPPAASKEEALADKILGSLPTGTSPVISTSTGSDTSTGTSTGSDTSTGISTGIKQKPVSVPDDDEDGMDIDVIMQDYIEALFPTKPDGSLSGRALVCKRIGITEDVGRLVHQRLKKSGCIRVDGSKTFPECTKDEMIERMTI